MRRSASASDLPRAGSFSRLLARLLTWTPADQRLQKGLELLAGEFAIAKNLCEEAWTDGFSRMNRHHGDSTIRVAQKVVTTFHPRHFETHLNQRRDDVFPGHPREPGHQPTVTF